MDLSHLPDHIKKVIELISTNSKESPIIWERYVWETDKIITLLYKGFGIYCDIHEKSLIIGCPGNKQEFTHDDCQQAINMINQHLDFRIEARRVLYEYEMSLSSIYNSDSD